MPPVTHILVPFDFSKAAHKALDLASEIATRFEAQLTLLHICDFAESIAKYGNALPYNNFSHIQLEESLLSERTQELTALEKKLAKKNIKVTARVYSGQPEQAILKIAESQKCDLIIIGSRGLKPVQSFLLGSVSTYVLHHTKCPVLLVHG